MNEEIEIEVATIDELEEVAEAFGYSTSDYVKLHRGHRSYRMIQDEVQS